MANIEDIDTDLTLELDGPGISPETFQKAVRAFFGVLSEVTKTVCQDGQAVRWRVQVKAGSNLIGVTPIPGFRPEIVGMIAGAMHDGMDALENDTELPPTFTEAAIRHARDLAEIVGTNPEETIRVRLWVDRVSLPVTHQAVLSTEKLVAGQYQDYGSIDGRLQTVSERGAMRFVVYDILTDRGINCFIDSEQADQAIRNFRRRVEVYGVISYRRDGVPLSIKVEDIVPFPASEDVPDFRAVRGILRPR